MAYLTAAIVITLSVLEGHSLFQAFSSVTFYICGVLHSHTASAELLVNNIVNKSGGNVSLYASY